MSTRSKFIVLFLIISIVVAFPPTVNGHPLVPADVTIAPTPPAVVCLPPATVCVSQGGFTSYSLSVNTPLSLFGGPDPPGVLTRWYRWTHSGVAGAISPNFIKCTSAGGCPPPAETSTFTVTASSVPGDYCPGLYPFNVMLTNTKPPHDSGPPVAMGEIDVIPTGPPLWVAVSRC